MGVCVGEGERLTVGMVVTSGVSTFSGVGVISDDNVWDPVLGIIIFA